MATILVTGGAGYIGSHVSLELLQNGHDVIVVDDLSNSKIAAIQRVEKLTNHKLGFHELDIRDADGLDRILEGTRVDAIIHMAGLKAVGESVAQPLRYYDVNVGGAVTLFGACVKHGIQTMVFSSSATVYGADAHCPIREDAPTGAINPYGETKHTIEKILFDCAASGTGWRVVNLRYFNPVGAHPSGEIGEDPLGEPNNLFPIVAQVAVGRRERLKVFGNDYDTVDGTGVRDYIHVCDLAKAHVRAVEYAIAMDADKAVTFNLGTGTGYSVLQVIDGWKKATGGDIAFDIVERRPGDAATCFADPSFAESELGWKATHSIEDMCRDHWNFQRNNPEGYPSQDA